ncbi:MAG: hypothetical protein F7C33_05385 [Desulfurococcales archaeon]|nr:hypothetical protein [Desulfurococcales archaeon]
MLSVREWRRIRDQAGKLQYIIAEIQERNPGSLSEAKKIYRDWQAEKITYREATEKLRELAAKTCP